VAKVNGDDEYHDLEDEIVNQPNEAAKRLLENVQRLCEVSWTTALQAADCERITEILTPVVSATGIAAGKAATLDVCAELALGTTPDDVLTDALHGLYASNIYCTMGALCGPFRNLIVEEVSESVVQCAKTCVRELVVPGLTQGSADRPLVGSYSPEQITQLCALVCELFASLHEFLSRQSLREEQLHQVVHMAISVFFLPEPQLREDRCKKA